LPLEDLNCAKACEYNEESKNRGNNLDAVKQPA
jgi:hypothetical protein